MVKLAFETISAHKTTAREWAMTFASSGIWIHCEVIFSDQTIGNAVLARKGGVGIYPKRTYNENWRFFDLQATKEQEQAMKQYFQQKNAQKYNWTGIFAGMIAGANITNKNGQHCSEICYNALLKAGILPNYGFKAYQLSPSNLYEIIKKAGFKTTTKP